MGKILKVVLPIAGAIAGSLLLPGIGTSLGLSIGASVGASLGGLAGSLVSSAIKVKPSAASSASQISRLSLTFDPDTARKIVVGADTAMGTDVVYHEPSGANQEYHDYIIACAAHAVSAIKSIRSDTNLIWTSAGGVQGIYAGYLTVDVRLEGTAANAIPINGGTTWNSNCRMTGCAYVHIRIKRTGNDKKAESPFAGGLPGRMTIIGDGAFMYDPRRDSTRGGSGSHRADNQATWEFTSGGTQIGGNPELQKLWIKIGWRIGGVVSVGAGMPLDRIDFADYITSANICDEMVGVTGGGLGQRRYETAGLFADSDDPATIIGALCAHSNSELRDVNGKLGTRVAHNDLSGMLPHFDFSDALGAYNWTGFAALNETKNVVRGRFTDPSPASLYQPAPFSTISTTSPDGINRSDTLDLLLCQNAERAQRIATQVLLRQQFSGTFTVDVGPRGWSVAVGDAVTWSFPPAGLLNQKFRVVSQGIKIVLDDGDAQAFCPMTFEVDDPAVYVYTPGVVALPADAIPAVGYNPLNNPLAITDGSDIGVENGATGGDNLVSNAALQVDTTSWVIDAGVTRTAAAPTDPAAYFSFTAGPPLTATANSNVGRPVIAGEKFYASVDSIRGGSPVGAFQLILGWYTAAGGFVSQTLFDIMPTVDAVWTPAAFTAVAPSGAGLMFVQLASNISSGGVAATLVRVTRSQPGADVTALSTPSLTVPPSTTIQADYAGNVAGGQLPRTLQGLRQRGNTDVSTTTDWTGTTFSAGVTGSIDGNGLVTITAVASNGQVNWSSIRDGVALTGTTVVNKNLGASPAPSGGTAGSVDYTTSITSAAATTYGGANTRILKVTCGASGSVSFDAPLDFTSSVTGSRSALGKAQWRVVGGTFADIAGETASDYPAVGAVSGGDNETGYIQVTQTKTGLTPGTVYEVQLLLRKLAGSGTLYFNGTCTASSS